VQFFPGDGERLEDRGLVAHGCTGSIRIMGGEASASKDRVLADAPAAGQGRGGHVARDSSLGTVQPVAPIAGAPTAPIPLSPAVPTAAGMRRSR
jgi:hypothetical protein